MKRRSPHAAGAAAGDGDGARAQLARFGLDADRAQTPVANLSGGEKARLLLALATRDAPQLLILDEPTNHLDIDAREALVKALADFDGAVLLITHDPHLVELIADRLWLVADGTVRPFDGDLDDYRSIVGRARAAGDHRGTPGDGRTPRTGRGACRVGPPATSRAGCRGSVGPACRRANGDRGAVGGSGDVCAGSDREDRSRKRTSGRDHAACATGRGGLAGRCGSAGSCGIGSVGVQGISPAAFGVLGRDFAHRFLRNAGKVLEHSILLLEPWRAPGFSVSLLVQEWSWMRQRVRPSNWTPTQPGRPPFSSICRGRSEARSLFDCQHYRHHAGCGYQ